MINLEIVTPEKKVVDEAVDSVRVPTSNGEIGLLQNHAPLISALGPGILTYTKGGTNEQLVISGGFVEVSSDKVSILADVAETASDVDVDAAKAELGEAQKVLGEWKGTEEEFEIEIERLGRAQARLQLAGKN
ncbi:MAG: F0F1 ATP synthase subunit epsilon [Pyrinomonadaceae bacterium]